MRKSAPGQPIITTPSSIAISACSTLPAESRASYAEAMDGYRTQASDVHPDVERVLVEAWRSMSAAEKVRQVRELTNTARRFSLAGIRRRHPDASDRELRLRLASFWLDRETMIRLFDWDPEVEGYG